LGDLVRLVVATIRGNDARLMYPAGRERSGNVGDDLGQRGIAVRTVEIYRAVAADALPAEVIRALGDGMDGALHYSRRSAATMLDLAVRAGVLNAVLNVEHYCLSAEVATPLRDAHARTRIAPIPEEEVLLDLVGPA
jgi:uroporphyrinogen-III synthase